MQGVQPAAKAIPKVSEPSIPLGLSCEKSLVSLYSAEIFNSPISCSPKATMTTPPMMRTQGLLVKAAPTSPAVVPRIRKITLNPALKASELRITACRLLLPSLRRSTLTPEINEIYPGTSGSTHGDKNDKMPAANEITIVTTFIFER